MIGMIAIIHASLAAVSKNEILLILNEGDYVALFRVCWRPQLITITVRLVMFWPGLAQKPRLWPGLRRPRPLKLLGRAKAINDGWLKGVSELRKRPRVLFFRNTSERWTK
jgi:hypothetical protein